MYEITYLNVEEGHDDWEAIVKKVLDKCFEEEGLLDSKLIITITFTTPEEIRKINKKYRKIDRATDVLSFPMFEKDELDEKIKNKDFLYEDVLGDIIISIDKVREQAEEYGHSFYREMCFLFTHGLLHLLGFDHMNEEDEKVMFSRQKEILNALNIERK